ncbi:hypothetical protein GGR22_000599 [Flavobacterium gossypii]|uniref:Apyrase n=1 Tax=Flavobacterium gossypii TaxID=1646119 RepID=A0ABR6DM03_9FLAO|nr:hypothetical protein [Flavobacterium gossypii]MBA9072473.1 hypothetical protein [Flavobacterium gossypii]
MQKFQLELLFQIIGIGSASGLVYKDNSLFIISDNSSVLYEYNIESKNLESHTILETTSGAPTENIPKAKKPDFEAIANFGEDCYIFGSGSTENRNKMVHFDTNQKQKIKETDVTDLYLVMQNFGNTKPEDFNIEGAVYNGENWFLFNRGNGKSGKNGIFTIGGNNLIDDFSVLYNSYKLPKIKGIQSSFTDAVRVDGKIYFLATVEDTKSTYDDGAVLGTFIGRLDIEKMKIDFTEKITTTHKFEGLTVYKENDKTIEFLLCEDKDNDDLKSDIYKLTLDK